MTIKQYLELDKIQETFKIITNDYINKHGLNIKELEKIQNTFSNINVQLVKLTQYFYEQ